jgi:hypothetical protein
VLVLLSSTAKRPVHSAWYTRNATKIRLKTRFYLRDLFPVEQPDSSDCCASLLLLGVLWQQWSHTSLVADFVLTLEWYIVKWLNPRPPGPHEQFRILGLGFRVGFRLGFKLGFRLGFRVEFGLGLGFRVEFGLGLGLKCERIRPKAQRFVCRSIKNGITAWSKFNEWQFSACLNRSFLQNLM